MKFYKLIVFMILLSLQLSLQVFAFEQKEFYEKNLRMKGIITHIIDDSEKQVQTGNSSVVKTKMCSSCIDKSKPCMACITKCGKGS